MKEIKIKNADEIIYEHTCKSGLKVYAWSYPYCEETSLTLTVKYGSIHTNFKVRNQDIKVPNGMAHFLEHIKFNEKNNVSAHEWFSKKGSYVNAYTTYNHTCYEVVCSDNLKDNLTHLLEFVFNPYFTKGLIAKEKPIIVEEASMTLDNPYNTGYRALLNNLYFNNNKKYLVTGQKDDIKSINYEDVLNVFNNFYHPENMFLVVTGNINPYEVAKIADSFFEKIDFPKFSKPVIIKEKEPDKVRVTSEELNVNVTKEKLLLAFKVPRKHFDLEELKLRLLINIILYTNFGNISKLKEDLLIKKLIDDFYYQAFFEDDHIVVIFESSTSYPMEVSKQIKEKFNNMDLSEETFKRRIKSMIACDILGYEDPVDVNSDIRDDIISYNLIINNTIDILRSVEYEDTKKIINKLRKNVFTEVILKPRIK